MYSPHAHKNRIGTSTPLPPKKTQDPPIKNEEFYGHGGFPAEISKKCQAPIELAQPVGTPELRAEKNYGREAFFLMYVGSGVAVYQSFLQDDHHESCSCVSERTRPHKTLLQLRIVTSERDNGFSSPKLNNTFRIDLLGRTRSYTCARCRVVQFRFSSAAVHACNGSSDSRFSGSDGSSGERGFSCISVQIRQACAVQVPVWVHEEGFWQFRFC